MMTVLIRNLPLRRYWPAHKRLPFIAGAEESQSLLKTQKHLITHQQEEKYRKKHPNRYGAYVFQK
jgi:hypothetical protein